MRIGPSKAANSSRSIMSALRRFRDEDKGTTAVEFAIICVPFVSLLMGIISVCLYFFTVLELEGAVWNGSRDLRVGNVQQGSGAYAGLTGDQLKDAFKQAICNRMRDPGDCFSKLRVLVQSRSDFSAITEPNCKDGGGNLISNSAANASWDAGGSSSVVVVTGCYSWEFGGKLPFFNIGNLPGGAFLVQASYTARTEPYN